MKPGDLVTFKFRGDAWRGEYYDLLTRDLVTVTGGVFCVGDVGITLETKVDVHTFCRVLTPQGDGWIVQDLIKRVTRETGRPGKDRPVPH